MGGQLLRIGKDGLIPTPSKSKNTLPPPNPPPHQYRFFTASILPYY